MTAEQDDITSLTNDPVAELLLRGRAETVREAEEPGIQPGCRRFARSGVERGYTHAEGGARSDHRCGGDDVVAAKAQLSGILLNRGLGSIQL
jgi:hypothetical protein